MAEHRETDSGVLEAATLLTVIAAILYLLGYMNMLGMQSPVVGMVQIPELSVHTVVTLGLVGVVNTVIRVPLTMCGIIVGGFIAYRCTARFNHSIAVGCGALIIGIGFGGAIHENAEQAATGRLADCKAAFSGDNPETKAKQIVVVRREGEEIVETTGLPIFAWPNSIGIYTSTHEVQLIPKAEVVLVKAKPSCSDRPAVK